MILKINHLFSICFHLVFSFFLILDFLIINFSYFEKNTLIPYLAYLLSYCIFSFLKFLAVWEEIGEKNLVFLGTVPQRILLELYTCGMMTIGYDIENENEWHLRVGISFLS